MEKKIPKKCVGSDVCIGAVCLSDIAGKRISKKRAVEYASTTPDGKYPRACNIHAWKNDWSK